MDPRTDDLTGRVFGKLTVIGFVFKNERQANGTAGRRRTDWLCRCECGTEKRINGQSLKRGKTKSCGCIRKNGESVFANPSQVNYSLIHAMVKRRKGKATAHKCVVCGKPATCWSYDHLDPDEHVEEHFVDGIPIRKLVFSTDPSHYQAKCTKHNIADQYTIGARAKLEKDVL